MKFEKKETRREIFHVVTKEGKPPGWMAFNGRVLGMEFNQDSQQTEILIEYDVY